MNSFRQIALLLLIALVGLAPMGCKKAEVRERSDALNYSMQVYGSLVRWGEWPDAAAYHKPRNGESELPDFKALEGIRVTDYKMLGSAGDAETGEAVAETRIEYHYEFDNRIRTLHQRQSWYYSEEDERWWLDSPFPQF